MNRLVRTICMYVCVCVCVCVLSHVQLFATLWIIAHQAPLSMGFSRQEYWSRLPFPSTGDLLHPGIKPVSPASPALQADSLSLKPLGHLVRKISSVQFSSVAQSCPLFETTWIAARQASLSITNSWSSLKLTSIESVMPSSHLSSPYPPAPNPSQHQSLFQWVNSSQEVAKVLESQLKHDSFQRTPRVDLLQNGLVGSLCSSRDSQESSPTPQFKSINSSALSFLHSPTLASIHDHWKNHSLD